MNPIQGLSRRNEIDENEALCYKNFDIEKLDNNNLWKEHLYIRAHLYVSK